MAQRHALIFIGAEAEVLRSQFLALSTVRKVRVAKTYRHPALDERLRRERTKAEALTMADAHAAGVRVPRILDVDLSAHTIEMEEIQGEPLRAHIERGDPHAVELAHEFGRLVGRLHNAKLTHGDLTTSNVLVDPQGLVLVDFGLAQRSEELEARGVDLHLVERTFDSSHPGRPELHRAFIEGYRQTFQEAPRVLARVQEIVERGRYA